MVLESELIKGFLKEGPYGFLKAVKDYTDVMSIDNIIEKLLEQGIVGIVMGFMCFLVWKMQGRLFAVIENNTKAMTDLKGTVKELAEAQKRRRQEFT